MKSQGHLDDSSDNRKILMELANDVKAMLEKTHTIITGTIKNQKTDRQPASSGYPADTRSSRTEVSIIRPAPGMTSRA